MVRGGRGANGRRGNGSLVPSPHHVLLLWCLLPGLQEEQGLQIELPVALEECHGAEVRVSTTERPFLSGKSTRVENIPRIFFTRRNDHVVSN